MNRKKSIPIVLLLLLGGLCAYAQNGTARLVGKVFERMEIGADVVSEASLNYPVNNARIVLETEDSTYVSTSSLAGSNPGGFVFDNIKPGTATLTITHKDFNTFSETATLEAGDNVAMIVLVRAKERIGETLEAAVVTEEAPLITYRGDTLVYHAAKMDIREGDYVIDIIKNLPGVKYNNQSLEIDGKMVVRTYVNGSLIFGKHPMAAMENLSAQQLVAMEVYDEDNPEDYIYGTTSLKDRVVNLKTKEPIFSVFDIQTLISAGADATPAESGENRYRYALGGNAKFFSELRQLSADLVASNLGLRSSNIVTPPSVLVNYNENKTISLVYNKYWNNVLQGDALELSYNYSNDWNRSRHQRQSEFFAVGDVPHRFIDASSELSNTQSTHNAISHLKITSLKHIILAWHNTVSLTENENRNRLKETVLWEGMSPMGKDEEIGNNMNSWNIAEKVSLTPLIGGKRPFTAILDFEIGNSGNDSWDVDTLSTSYLRRNLVKDSDNRNLAYGLTVRKVIYPGSKKSINLEYIIKYNGSSYEQMAFDLDPDGNIYPNIFNTFDYTNSVYSSAISANSVIFRRQNMFVNAKVTPTVKWINNLEKNLDIQTKRTYISLNPDIDINCKDWSILHYSVSSIVPSIQQIRNRIDDTDAMRIRVGNPDLKQSLTHSLSSSYSKTKKSSSFNFKANLQIVERPILNRTFYYSNEGKLPDYNDYLIPAGATLTTYVNGPARITSDLALEYTTSFNAFNKFLKSTLRLSPSFKYINDPIYFGDVLDRTTETAPALTVDFSTRVGKQTRLSFKDNIQDIHGNNKNGTMSHHILRHTYSASADLTLFKKMKLSTSYSRNIFKPINHEEGKKVDIQRLNIEAGIDVFKGRCKITLSGYDLLSGGSEYSESFTESSYIKTWTPSYGRYCLLKLTYRFNNTNGKLIPDYGVF